MSYPFKTAKERGLKIESKILDISHVDLGEIRFTICYMIIFILGDKSDPNVVFSHGTRFGTRSCPSHYFHGTTGNSV